MHNRPTVTSVASRGSMPSPGVDDPVRRGRQRSVEMERPALPILRAITTTTIPPTTTAITTITSPRTLPHPWEAPTPAASAPAATAKSAMESVPTMLNVVLNTDIVARHPHIAITNRAYLTQYNYKCQMERTGSYRCWTLPTSSNYNSNQSGFRAEKGGMVVPTLMPSHSAIPSVAKRSVRMRPCVPLVQEMRSWEDGIQSNSQWKENSMLRSRVKTINGS
mmetsp:Transcript_40831/g.69793  ORF Transcript_40831/g.69793 Transcript_40831/m.69793 type:complete len:221 (+) Transcript_40831:214-876(+)